MWANEFKTPSRIDTGTWFLWDNGLLHNINGIYGHEWYIWACDMNVNCDELAGNRDKWIDKRLGKISSTLII